MCSAPKKTVILAFSGGLDTSAIVPWLQDTLQARVIAYCSDLGNAPDPQTLRPWALKLGASEFIFEDLKDEFVSRFVFPAIRAGAIYQDEYLLGTPLGRPLIAERLVHYAKIYGADAIVHGCTGKGNDQLRFDRSIAYLAPGLEIVAPWRVWDFKGRQDLTAYLAAKGFFVPAKTSIYSEDVNLLHRSCEGGGLETLESSYDPSEVMDWVNPSASQKDGAVVEIGFENGLPASLNGEFVGGVELLDQLNKLAGMAGIGFTDMVDERINGIKGRCLYETPGGTVLHYALKHLKHICWNRTVINTARTLGHSYAELVYDGLWHGVGREACEAYFAKAAQTLNGAIKLKLAAGQMIILGRHSRHSLYDNSAASFESDDEGIHHTAEGYSQIARYRQKSLGKQKHCQSKSIDKTSEVEHAGAPDSVQRVSA